MENRSYFEQPSNTYLGKIHPRCKKQTGVCSFITAFSGYQQWHTQSCTLLLFNVFDNTVLCELLRSFSLLFLAVSTSLHSVCNIFSQKHMICLLSMATWTDVLHGCIYPQVRQVPLCANRTFPWELNKLVQADYVPRQIQDPNCTAGVCMNIVICHQLGTEMMPSSLISMQQQTAKILGKGLPLKPCIRMPVAFQFKYCPHLCNRLSPKFKWTCSSPMLYVATHHHFGPLPSARRRRCMGACILILNNGKNAQS